MIKGKEREQKNFTKYVGMFNANVIAVNPTKEELEKILGTELQKDVEYTGHNDETGAKKLTLSFWLKEVTTGSVFNVRFNLEDTIVESKSGKTQYVNAVGNTSYAESEDQLPTWFTTRDYRKARRGEDLLYNFLTNWLNDIDFRNDPDAEARIDDWKKFIGGNVKEIRDAIDAYKSKEVCALATIRTSAEGAEYQSVYSREFLPGFALDQFNGKSAKQWKVVDKFCQKVEDVDYGCKDYYELTPLKEYDPSKNVIATSDSAIIADHTDNMNIQNTDF